MIRDRLPKPVDHKLVQAKIESDLFDQVREQMKKDDISWPDLLRTCFLVYLEESRKQKKS